MKNLLLLMILSWVVSTSAFANKRCGLGSKFFGKSKAIISQMSEITTNAASSEANSITSGTSGCKHNGNLITPSLGKVDIKKEAIEEQNAYADVNFEELKMEMAMGKGEVLTGFAASFGCEKASNIEFIKMTHDQYGEIVTGPNATPSDLVNKIREKIRTNSTLKTNCWLG